MDPNETLKQLRSNVAAALQLADDYEKDPDAASAEDAEDAIGLLDVIAQQVEALDQWLTRGGFLPAAWAVTASTLCQASIDGFHCSRPVHLPTWKHVALTSDGQVRRAWTDDEPDHPHPYGDVDRMVDAVTGPRTEIPEPLGPPNPAHASTELIDQLDAELARAGEIVRRMRREH
jgi:hypothetical protein